MDRIQGNLGELGVGFLAKPFTIQEVTRAVRRALAGEST